MSHINKSDFVNFYKKLLIDNKRVLEFHNISKKNKEKNEKVLEFLKLFRKEEFDIHYSVNSLKNNCSFYKPKLLI